MLSSMQDQNPIKHTQIITPATGDEPLAPRKDLNRSAFEKYAPFIGRALISPIKINPREAFARPMKANTFVARFNDATRGYRLYGYTSLHVPKEADVSFLVARETIDGMVVVRNTRPGIEMTPEQAIAALQAPSEATEAERSLLRELGQ